LSSILGFGAYVPEHVLTNPELAERLGCTQEWIHESSGIEYRRIADESQSVVDLAVLAAKDCLGAANLTPNELGMLILSSGSSDRRFPGPAAQVGRELGVSGVPCLDVPLASAGSLFGLALAASLAPMHGPILVIGSEKMSSVSLREPLDKNIAILFGDGAGACVVVPGAGPLSILGSALHSDGAYSEELRLGFDGRLAMNGLSVILQASRKIPAGIREVLDKHTVEPAAIEVFLMHQANQNLIDRVARALGVTAAKFYSNIALYGNTSSASMLIAASEYFRENTIAAGAYVCFGAFGAGFHWGAMLAQST
jgi:3-oxoacyl-[acyl-carrier-protein] synthase III